MINLRACLWWDPHSPCSSPLAGIRECSFQRKTQRSPPGPFLTFAPPFLGAGRGEEGAARRFVPSLSPPSPVGFTRLVSRSPPGNLPPATTCLKLTRFQPLGWKKSVSYTNRSGYLQIIANVKYSGVMTKCRDCQGLRGGGRRGAWGGTLAGLLGHLTPAQRRGGGSRQQLHKARLTETAPSWIHLLHAQPSPAGEDGARGDKHESSTPHTHRQVQTPKARCTQKQGDWVSVRCEAQCPARRFPELTPHCHSLLPDT